VEPHAVGYDSSGQLTLSGWQLSGKNGQGFRDFRVNDIRLLTVTQQQFAGPRPDYGGADKTMQRIVAEIAA
jgi:hypothetical protein